MAIFYNIFLYNSKCTVPVFEMVPKKSDSRFFFKFCKYTKDGVYFIWLKKKGFCYVVFTQKNKNKQKQNLTPTPSRSFYI